MSPRRSARRARRLDDVDDIDDLPASAGVERPTRDRWEWNAVTDGSRRPAFPVRSGRCRPGPRSRERPSRDRRHRRSRPGSRARSRPSSWRRPNRSSPACSPSWSSCRSRASSSCAPQLAAEYERRPARVRARPRRRRLPVPDASRPGAVRRALRARGPARPALGAGARDARDRRVQAADLARPDLGHPRRQRRVDAAAR